MPSFRLWPIVGVPTARTSSPTAAIESNDIEQIDGFGNSWGDRRWRGDELVALRELLERDVAHDLRSDDGEPLAAVLESILVVVDEARRVAHSYELHYVGD